LARPFLLARRDPKSDALASVKELDDARMDRKPGCITTTGPTHVKTAAQSYPPALPMRCNNITQECKYFHQIDMY
jgi:hypothetical protein